MKSAQLALLCLAALSAISAGTVQTKKQERPTCPDIAPDTVIYEITDQMPLFQEYPIELSLSQWIGKHIRYPMESSKTNAQGKVLASFVVEPDSSISNIGIISSPDKALSDEVLRVLRNMPPAWTPGIDSTGRAVRVQIAVPVIFRLD